MHDIVRFSIKDHLVHITQVCDWYKMDVRLYEYKKKGIRFYQNLHLIQYKIYITYIKKYNPYNKIKKNLDIFNINSNNNYDIIIILLL